MKRLIVWTAMLFLVACTTAADETGSEEGAVTHMDSHGVMGEHIHADVPAEYIDLTNPVAGDETAVAAGQTIYDTYCASCHGEGGQGDGPAAEALDPKPANLADGMMMMDLGDNYLFWRISEGGAMEPFNSAMPAWKNSLTEDQRWQLVNYVRSLSGEAGEHTEEHSDSH